MSHKLNRINGKTVEQIIQSIKDKLGKLKDHQLLFSHPMIDF